MRKTILLLFLFTSILLSAQKFETGPEFAINELPIIAGMNDELLFTGLRENTTLYCMAFNKKSLEKVMEKEVELDLRDYRSFSYHALVEKHGFINDRHSIFFSFREKGKEKGTIDVILYVQQVNAISGEKYPVREILRYNETIGSGIKNATPEEIANITGKFRLTPNTGRNKMLVQYYIYDLDRKVYRERLALFDADLNMLIQKEFTDRQDASEVITANSSDLDIDDEGSVYGILNKEIFYLDVFKEYELWQEPIPLEGVESNAAIFDLKGVFNDEGNYIVTGSYISTDLENMDENKESAEQKKGDTQLEGVVYYEIDGLNKEISKMKISKFSEKLIDEFLTVDMIKRNLKTEVNNIFNNYQYFFAEEKTIVIAESVLEGENNDLLICNYDKNGDLIWGHRLAKEQRQYKSRGFFSFIGNGSLYILIMDEENNYKNNQRLDLDISPIKSDNNALPVLFSYDLNTGERTVEVHREWNSGALQLIPENAYQRENNEAAFILAKDNYKAKLGAFKFD